MQRQTDKWKISQYNQSIWVYWCTLNMKIPLLKQRNMVCMWNFNQKILCLNPWPKTMTKFWKVLEILGCRTWLAFLRRVELEGYGSFLLLGRTLGFHYHVTTVGVHSYHHWHNSVPSNALHAIMNYIPWTMR